MIDIGGSFAGGGSGNASAVDDIDAAVFSLGLLQLHRQRSFSQHVHTVLGKSAVDHLEQVCIPFLQYAWLNVVPGVFYLLFADCGTPQSHQTDII
jgi:hypothetical protein